MTTVLFVLLLVALLAYANGANDTFKGVATIHGSGTLGYRSTIGWATGATLAGSLTALFISERLLLAFTGKGLVPPEIVGTPAFVGAVAFGAAGAVLAATLLKLPVSTTHALVGALVGAGLVVPGGDVRFAVLGTAFFLPLLASPAIAMVLSMMLQPLVAWLGRRTGKADCVCLVPRPAAITAGEAVAAQASSGIEVMTCTVHPEGTLAAVRGRRVLDGVHVLSGGAVSFARGLNDTPKITALLVAGHALQVPYALTLVGLAMALGAILQARGVGRTVSHGITAMRPGQGFAANLVTAGLVIFASRWGVPVSTTHVSCGSLFGLGMATRKGKWRMIVTILAAWVATLPAAALVAAGAAALAT